MVATFKTYQEAPCNGYTIEGSIANKGSIGYGCYFIWPCDVISDFNRGDSMYPREVFSNGRNHRYSVPSEGVSSELGNEQGKPCNIRLLQEC